MAGVRSGVPSYSNGMKILHWVMSVLIIGLLVAGILMTRMENSDFKWEVYGLHKSFGFIALLFILLRTFVRFRSDIPPLPKTIKEPYRKLSSFTVFLLYLFMFIMPCSGFLMSMCGDHGLSVFGYQLPDFLPKCSCISSIAYKAHITCWYFFIAVILIHILGTTKHTVFDKMGMKYLRRMM